MTPRAPRGSTPPSASSPATTRSPPTPRGRSTTSSRRSAEDDPSAGIGRGGAAIGPPRPPRRMSGGLARPRSRPRRLLPRQVVEEPFEIGQVHRLDEVAVAPRLAGLGAVPFLPPA